MKTITKRLDKLAFLQTNICNSFPFQELETIVTKRLEKDGMIGMAVAGGAVVAVGGLVGLGLAMAGRQMMKK